VDGFGREILEFTVPMPNASGSYTAIAELVSKKGKPVRSLRDFKVLAETK